MIADNIAVNNKGHLCFAGMDVTELADKYGTPLYLMDKMRIRDNIRLYKKAFSSCMPQGSKVLFASKACSFKDIYHIAHEEGIGADVVSRGEIYTALKAGFPLNEVYFHGNNKTDTDIAFAMDNGIGCFVSDGMEEVLAIEKEAARRGIRQKIMLRLTPGIDPHTYDAVSTGKVDSKFGTAIETGQAEEILSLTLKQKHLDLCGFHCHVGSEVFWEDVFERATIVMLEFIALAKEKYEFVTRELNLGGGYGVRYIESDPIVSIPDKITSVASVIHEHCIRLGLSEPVILMEPGRSIVADAGLTVYTCGAVKRILGYKNYVSIDGGMADNPRYALYEARYTCLPAGKMDESRNFKASLVGCCCESDDVIQHNVMFPDSIERGDIIAVCTTGAYNYSMASNYNRLPRPAVVMIDGLKDYIAVRRESLDDVVSLDV